MDTFLVEHHGTMQIKEIADHLGVTSHRAYHRMRKLGISGTRMTVKRSSLRNLGHWSPTDWAYFAGLVDAEGTVSCQLTRGKYLRPHLSVTNTSYSLMRWLESLGMYCVLLRNGNGNLYWKAEVSGFGILPVLENIRPWVKIRTRRYDILMEIIHIRTAAGYRFRPTPRIMSLLEELKALNMRGSQLEDSLTRAGESTTSLRPRSVLSRTE
jgi:hypothetical protein